MAGGGWAGRRVARGLNSTVCLWLSPSMCVSFSELLTSLSQTHNVRTHTAALLLRLVCQNAVLKMINVISECIC